MSTGAVLRSPAAPGLGAARLLPALVEAVLVVAAIALLLPFFDRVAELGSGRDRRFLDRGLAVAGLPEPVLPAVCAAVGGAADPNLRAALCEAQVPTSLTPPTDVPPVLGDAIARAIGAFSRPLREAEARAAALRAANDADDGAARDPLGATDADRSSLLDHAGAIAAIEADLAPFRERFRITAGADAGPAPLRCAARWLEAMFAARPAGDLEPAAAAMAAGGRAHAALLLGAALDGRAPTAALAHEVALPAASVRATACRSGAAESLAATAALMADARQAGANARKNEAMRELTRTAGLQWAAAMSLGFAFLMASRRTVRPALGIAAALAVWAGAAWLGRVPWPFAEARGFVPARVEVAWASAPDPFVLALLAAAALLAVAALSRRRATAAGPPPVRQAMSSRLGYPGLVLATGAGGLLLLDLSLTAHVGNRYLALYHQGHLWGAMLAFSVLLFARRPLARGLAWALSVAGEAVQRASRRLGGAGVALALLAAAAAAVLAFGFALAHLRQLTSELGRIWLILGAAWFFFLRAGPLTERIARGGPAALSLLRYAWPLLLVAGVLVAAMLVTRDMGPLLIAAYGAGAFLAATLAMWWHHRSGRVAAALALALLLFAAWIGAVTAALFEVGAHDSVTASRLESVAAPFASINDQLALVSWFQRAAPAEGFGLGAVPWCGFATGRSCSGVPAQIHSDYTFTALAGVFGPLAALAAALAMAVWLHRLVRRHGRVTGGEPRLVHGGGRPGAWAADGQALLSWIAVAWVVLTSCQLAVTVAGNLAVLPLTGVTFPFVSFGMTSLAVNMGFLALCLNVDVPARAPAAGGAHG